MLCLGLSLTGRAGAHQDDILVCHDKDHQIDVNLAIDEQFIYEINQSRRRRYTLMHDDGHLTVGTDLLVFDNRAPSTSKPILSVAMLSRMNGDLVLYQLTQDGAAEVETFACVTTPRD